MVHPFWYDICDLVAFKINDCCRGIYLLGLVVCPNPKEPQERLRLDQQTNNRKPFKNLLLP